MLRLQGFVGLVRIKYLRTILIYFLLKILKITHSCSFFLLCLVDPLSPLFPFMVLYKEIILYRINHRSPTQKIHWKLAKQKYFFSKYLPKTPKSDCWFVILHIWMMRFRRKVERVRAIRIVAYTGVRELWLGSHGRSHTLSISNKHYMRFIMLYWKGKPWTTKRNRLWSSRKYFLYIKSGRKFHSRYFIKLHRIAK